MQTFFEGSHLRYFTVPVEPIAATATGAAGSVTAGDEDEELKAQLCRSSKGHSRNTMRKRRYPTRR